MEVPNRRLACLGVAKPVAPEQPMKLLAREVVTPRHNLEVNPEVVDEAANDVVPPVAVHRRDSQGESLVLFVIARV